jgi:hypothetical protein
MDRSSGYEAVSEEFLAGRGSRSWSAGIGVKEVRKWTRTLPRGISLGCPLSPVMAALYLEPLDRRMEATGLFYARFMDDWVILAPTR